MTSVPASPAAAVGGLLPTGINILHYEGDGPAPIQRILEACSAERDPEREGWRIILATARAVAPEAALDRHVDLALLLAPPSVVAVTDRRLVEDIALTMLATVRGGA